MARPPKPQPWTEVQHSTDAGWKWIGHNGLNSLVEWGQGFMTRGMAEAAAAEWLANQRGLAARLLKPRDKKNGKGTRNAKR